MRLSTYDESSRFELKILRYEFPRIEQDKWDSNWLMIEVVASNQDGSFYGVAPCLLTWEVKRLIAWLKELKSIGKVTDEFSSMEDQVVFHFDTQTHRLKVFLYHRWRQVKLLGKFADDLYEIWLEFPLSELNLGLAIHQLETQLAQFPERTNSKKS